MAEVHMINFENELLKGSMYRMKIKKWIRYIDNVLIIWEVNSDKIKVFIKELKKIEKWIQCKDIGNREINCLNINIKVKK